MKWIILFLCFSFFNNSIKGTDDGTKSLDFVKAVNSGYWSNPLTWDCNCIPSKSTNVLIGDDQWVIIENNAEVNDLYIDNSGGLEFSWNKSVTLDVTGNFNVDGFIDRGFGIVRFSSKINQRLEGWADFHQLEVTGPKTLFVSGYISIMKSISADASTIYSEGGLHVWISNSEFIGFIGDNGGNIAGSAIVHGVLGIVQEMEWPHSEIRTEDKTMFDCEYAQAALKEGTFPRRNSKGSRLIFNGKNPEKRENPKFKEKDIRPLHERLFEKQTEFSSVTFSVQNRN